MTLRLPLFESVQRYRKPYVKLCLVDGFSLYKTLAIKVLHYF
ncbi:hypothetical protein HMPREF9134_00386 [Porphyromonas catoniae F0037]|uniref:Uncharacterized protein n=1 Tax=Porphyromonas catoniae F0037 TaxID=1127696 RepID=L1NGS5_9PORP|nr:hypothetical protein HMPREF9134_00386 [Porphyromonas catoniae F0037]